MSVDDRDKGPGGEVPVGDKSASSSESNDVREALQTKTDEPHPPDAEAIVELDAERKHPLTPQGRRRRFLNRRNFFIATIFSAIGLVALILLILIVYRLGYVDRYVAGQIKETFAKYGIRAEIKDFHAGFPPQTVEMLGVELYDAQTNEKLAKIDRLVATIRIEDLYALNLQRNINLKDLKVEGLEAWVTFDAQGRSNFRNITIPPADTNRRILFAYTAANIEVKSGVIHYGDVRHEISGEARNLTATILPKDPSAPPENQLHAVTFAVSNSTFTYDGRPVNNIDILAQLRLNETRAEIQELVLHSPVAEARLTGTMDDWRALHYQMDITSSVDLTQLSDVLQAGTALRGTGKFAGKVSGEGDKYKVDGNINSDSLAAANLRLQGLNVTAKGSGQGRTYDINGKAVASLLTAGDFQLNNVQLVGGVMGTGSDFRWVGELRAVAEKSYGTTIAGLILHDARAEMNDGALTASSSQFSANSLVASGTRANGITANDLRVRSDNGVTTGSVARVKAGTITASGAKVDGVTANNIDIVNRDGVTSVVVKSVQIGAWHAAGAEIGSINIAGVRLSVRDGRMQGSTADIDAGTVKLADGQVESVKLAKPVFVVEPSGRYRASADLSIGGGVLGQMNMGQARAQLVATNTELQLNNFTADIFKGRANGNARIAITRGGTSRIAATFDQVDVAGPLTAIAGAAVPLSGRATGKVDLSFSGTDFQQASGTLSTNFNADNLATDSGRVPLSGVVAIRADRGLFTIDQVDLQTTATKLKATGQFSFSADSNLQVDLNSTDAAELQTVLISSGLLPDIEEQMRTYGLELAGQLAFNGSLRGKLANPDIDGRVSLSTLLVNGTDLGALSANLKMTAEEMQIVDGRLTEKDGGGMQFTLNAPRAGQDNITFNATLDRVNAGNLLAALPLNKARRAQFAGTQSDASGEIRITGIPNAMNGSAELRFGPGRLAGEPLESMLARATFAGSVVKIESVDARLTAGHIGGSGTYDTTSGAFDLQGRAEGVQLSRLASLASQPQLSNVSGTADFNAHIIGNFSESDFSAFQITFDGQGKDVVINGRPAGTLALVGRTENKKLSIALTTGIFGATPQVVAANIDLGSEKLAANIETTLTNADLTGLLKILLPQATVDISGVATGTFKASGNLLDEDGYFSADGLQGTANFTSLTFKVADVQLVATPPLVVRFSPSEVTFEKTQFTGPGTNIALGGTLAVGPAGRQNMTADGQLNLRVLNGLSPDAFLSGTAEVAVRVTGTYEVPRLNGTASIAQGSFSVLIGNERWSIGNLKALVRFSANQAQIDSMTGTLGGGHISATGGALLEGFTLSRFLFNVHGDNVSAPYPTNFRTTGDIDLEIRGTAREQLIGGTVNVRRSEYTEDIELADLINFRQTESIEEGSEIEITRTALFSDLRVEGRNALVVRNNLADLVASVSLQVNGPVKDPLVSGRITATSGTLNFRNDRYDITRALMDWPPQRGSEPIINIQGETQIRGYRVTVGLTGPLSQPQAIISSEPALPQADVVSLITTGQLATGDTSTSILSQSGLGTATSLLTDALINAPAQRATSKLFGLSRFEINPVIGGTGSTPQARLTLGKRISKDVQVIYSTNVASDPNQILALEYRVSDRLFFVAQYEQASTRRLTTQNNNFSFEIRFRRRF
ncbi:MAG TPA: translocation/assembly module TamB domain-containing protein [Pyrinomonadaceae bacterium]|jgi:translocation and assembly module TamB|nr:translocation/assembly module TamB domain-containing protein [Pyrinomonadaceae bacterium]